MPLYEYQCTRCQRRIEKIQSFSAEPLTVCEACGGPLEKLISAPAIQFKGSGWYVTDYAKGAASGGRTGAKDADKDGGQSGGEAKAGSESTADTPAAPPVAAPPAAAAPPANKNSGGTTRE